MARHGLGNPTDAADGHVPVGDKPGVPERQPGSEVSAAADAGDADNLPLRSCMELISGALCIVNRSLSTKLAINIASAPPSTAEGTVRLETPLGELDRTTDESLDCPGTREDVADIHTIFLECPGVDGDKQRRLQQRYRRHRHVDRLERRLCGKR